MNDILQIVATAMILIAALAIAVKKFRRTDSCEDDCDGCPLSKDCKRK